jgi:pimeloyl-ACP methyl ester carboxylesterase
MVANNWPIYSTPLVSRIDSSGGAPPDRIQTKGGRWTERPLTTLAPVRFEGLVPPELTGEGLLGLSGRVACVLFVVTTLVHKRLSLPHRESLEARLIFQPQPKERLPEALKEREITVVTASGNKIHTLFWPPQQGQPTIVFSNGNSGKLSKALDFVAACDWLKKGYGVALYSYPGYGYSTGNPSQRAFSEALKAVSTTLSTVGRVPITDQVFVGWSIGGAVTIDVASTPEFNRLKGVVVLNTFTRMADILELMLTKKGLPPSLFPVYQPLVNTFNNVMGIAQIRAPIAIVYAGADERFPESFSQKLYRHANNAKAKNLTVVPDTDHGDIDNPRYATAVNDAIQSAIFPSGEDLREKTPNLVPSVGLLARVRTLARGKGFGTTGGKGAAGELFVDAGGASGDGG